MKTFLLILALLFTPTAEAGPIRWAKATVRWSERHPVVFKVLAASAVAGVHAKGLERCRLGDVERCQTGYGAAWVGFGVTTGLNFLMIPISEKLGGKQGAALSFGSSAVQLGYGVFEWRRYKPEKEKEKP